MIASSLASEYSHVLGGARNSVFTEHLLGLYGLGHVLMAMGWYASSRCLITSAKECVRPC